MLINYNSIIIITVVNIIHTVSTQLQVQYTSGFSLVLIYLCDFRPFYKHSELQNTDFNKVF